MQALLQKLNYKQEEAVHLFYVPEELAELPAFLSGQTAVISNLEDHSKPVRFAMLFVTEKSVLDAAVHAIAGRLEGDAIVWICYPKGSSKRYRCDFNRDTGWQVCGEYNLEPVRQVAVNEDWSALRFRKTAYIRQLTRSSEMALGDEARQRIEKKSNR